MLDAHLVMSIAPSASFAMVTAPSTRRSVVPARSTRMFEIPRVPENALPLVSAYPAMRIFAVFAGIVPMDESHSVPPPAASVVLVSPRYDPARL